MARSRCVLQVCEPVPRVLEQAFREFQEKTQLRFHHIDDCKATYGEGTSVCGDCKTALALTNIRDGCNANVGFMKTDNYDPYVNVGPGCEQYGTYVHELGHAIGLYHEHAHPNRQIVILRDKLRMPSRNYLKLGGAGTTPYDMGSAMHYDGADMCVPKDLTQRYCDIEETEGTNGCVIAKEEHCDAARQNEFGKASDLAPSDVIAIQKLYEGIALHPKAPPTSPVSSSPSPPPPATPPASTETPAPSPPPAVTTPPTSTTAPPASTPPTPSPPTTPPPGINFENFYEMLIEFGDLLAKRRRRLRH